MRKKNILVEFALVMTCAGLLAIVIFGAKKTPQSAAGPSVSYSSPSRKNLEKLGFLFSSSLKSTGGVFECFDFLCPPCHAQYHTVEKLVQGNASIEWRLLPFPLSIHRGSYDVALAS